MRLTLAAIGRMKSGPEQELVARYLDRLRKGGKAVGITTVDVLELPESRGDTADIRKRDEADALLQKLGNARLIAFDERGKTITSRAFADHIGQACDTGTDHLALIIGGPDGLHDDLRNRAYAVLAFGKLTMPHQIVRILVAEQVYRATTILTRHPYHRD